MQEDQKKTDISRRRGWTTSRKRLTLLLVEGGLVVGLLLILLLSETLKSSTSLVVLFLYSFPSEFLVGLVPHEPVLIFFGEAHAPWVVALVAGVSTVMAEGLNYHFFGLFYSIPTFRAAFQRESVQKIAELFSRLPFTAIVFAGFSPVPFFPVRFLVVITGYPVWKYLTGVFLSRTPRFYILAWLGHFFEVPTWALVLFFLGMLLLVNLPALSKILREPVEKESVASAPGPDTERVS